MGDSTAMTVEFLRARLLSERTVSKAAKEKAGQLAKRVMELEEQLRIMIIQRKKTEQAATEAISTLETNGMNDLSDAIDSSFDKNKSTIGEKGCKEHFRSELCTKASEERIVIADAQSNSHLENSSSQLMSLSRKSHRGNPNSPLKPKGKPIKQGYREKSFMFCVESSPKYSLGKSCYKIKQEDEGLASADLVDHYAINHDEFAKLSANVSGSSTSFLNKNEADGIDCVRDEEMERVLEQQAQLIGQFEAEEKAQQEWEKKYSENKISNLDYSEHVKLSYMTEVNGELQKDTLTCFEKIAYGDEEAKPDDIGVFPGIKEPTCPSNNHLLETLSNGERILNTSNEYDEHPVHNSSNDQHSGKINDSNTELGSPEVCDGLMSQTHQHVTDSDVEACFVEVTWPKQLSTVSSSLPKSCDGLVHKNNDHGSINNNSILAESYIDSLPMGSHSALNSRKDLPKWQLSGTQGPYCVKQNQSACSSLQVLEALQQAKVYLRQDLHRLPLPGLGTKDLTSVTSYHASTTMSDESLKGPIGSAGLLRLPSDTFHRTQNSDHGLYPSGLNLGISFPRRGCVLTTAVDHHSAIPYFEAGSKASASKFNISNSHPVMGPPSMRKTLPYSYSCLKPERAPLSRTGFPFEKKNSMSCSHRMELPHSIRYSLPSNLTNETAFRSRSASSVHQRNVEPFHLGTKEPPVSRNSLPRSDLKRVGMVLHDGLLDPSSDGSSQMLCQDQCSYGTQGQKSILHTMK
ncbi:uncharacterized protein LOC122029420 [Zingiber officinale]|uniref:uncharacterized protein LOC122029420 n=1 Tax=Zingiber officinale TaxID=94328 RepID=UPI001C4CA2EB|nr:uncharacterized protein LOC122029420 [Zingiber officinale]XP_042444331.1 uncharacterized protein LOC122029420 [Zingiber officinale]